MSKMDFALVAMWFLTNFMEICRLNQRNIKLVKFEESCRHVVMSSTSFFSHWLRTLLIHAFRIEVWNEAEASDHLCHGESSHNRRSLTNEPNGHREEVSKFLSWVMSHVITATYSGGLIFNVFGSRVEMMSRIQIVIPHLKHGQFTDVVSRIVSG